MEVGKTCLDGIGGGAGEGDQVDRVEATSTFPVESRSCSELPGTWGEGEVGGGLVQSGEVSLDLVGFMMMMVRWMMMMAKWVMLMYCNVVTCTWSQLWWESSRWVCPQGPLLQMLSLIINIMTLPLPSGHHKNMKVLHLSWTAVVNWVGMKRPIKLTSGSREAS